MHNNNPYVQALKVVLPKIRKAIHNELGMKAPETVDEWRKALSKRNTKEIECYVKYWMEVK